MEKLLNIHLRDINADLVAAWQTAFAGLPGVKVSAGDILEQEADAIVSPANSFGHMDGGIDLAYSYFFGWDLEAGLRKRIVEKHFGELPVGQAAVLPTGHARIPYLVSAPTMRVPGSIAKTLNVYLAFRAALIAVLEHNAQEPSSIETLLVPGLGTGIGEVPFERAARQMRAAYDAIIGGQGGKYRNVGIIWGEHSDLLA